MIKTSYAKLINGDCVEETEKLESESMGFSVFSPPFPELYCYSDNIKDMGNCKDYAEFEKHFYFLIPELYRVMISGRNVAIHCMDVPIQKGKHGYIGLRDFSGTIINVMQTAGFIYHSRVTIWKNPVTEMQRTKALGLLHKQLKKDSTMSRVGIPDYVLVFRKDGNRNSPVNCRLSVDEWQKYASPVWQFDDIGGEWEMILNMVDQKTYYSIPEKIRNKYATPVWMDIDYGDTLNVREAREEKDEKHICPLQLPTIERLLTLYTNEGDTVFTPFLGIGSEVYQAVKMGRKAVGIELKESYFNAAVKNIKSAELKRSMPALFS
jgi:DNA modification methylase